MKLATTTGDYSAYTDSQTTALAHLREAGFRYADYNFGIDYNHRNGVYTDTPEEYFNSISEFCHKIGITLVQAHAPMGDPLEDDGSFLADTLRCVDACGTWGIKNLVVVADFPPNKPLQKTKPSSLPCSSAPNGTASIFSLKTSIKCASKTCTGSTTPPTFSV